MNENNPVSLCKLLRRCDVAWTNFNFCFLMFSYMSFGKGKFILISKGNSKEAKCYQKHCKKCQFHKRNRKF